MSKLKSVLKVDNVGEMSKTGAKCVLKGEAMYDGATVKVSLTIACEDPQVFEELGVDVEDAKIEMVLQESAQTTLPDEDDG